MHYGHTNSFGKVLMLHHRVPREHVSSCNCMMHKNAVYVGSLQVLSVYFLWFCAFRYFIFLMNCSVVSVPSISMFNVLTTLFPLTCIIL